MGDKSLTAREGTLSRTMKSSLSELCIKYEDVRNVDRMAAVQASYCLLKPDPARILDNDLGVSRYH